MEITFRERIQVIVVHVVYSLCPAMLWFTLAGKASETREGKWMWLLILWGIIFFSNILLQAMIAMCTVMECAMAMKQWFSFHLFSFTLIMIFPYTKTVETIFEEAIRGNLSNGEEVKSCPADFSATIDDKHSLVTLIVLFAYLVYPFPRRYHHIRNYLIVAIEFLNVYDIMDLLKDLACLKFISGTWRAIQYVSMGISLLLVSFNVDTTKDFAKSVDICGRCCQARSSNRVQRSSGPHGGEGNEENDDGLPVKERLKETWRRIIKLLATIIFMNISFTVMRLRIMVEHETVDNGLVMAVKNCMMLMLNAIYLVRQIISVRKLHPQCTRVAPAAAVGRPVAGWAYVP